MRVIDNFKTSRINATCGMPEKQKLYGLDFLATTLVRSFTIEQGGAKLGMKGKTFDLSSACKQFPIHQDDRRVIRIAVPVPDKPQCQVFGLNALPFGATGSAAGFLRVSAAVFHLLTLGLGVWAGTFFDDFPILSRADVAQQTEDFSALGFTWTEIFERRKEVASFRRGHGSSWCDPRLEPLQGWDGGVHSY